MTFAFYEFFAGGGMARTGLGPGWRCLFANDIDPKKAAAYEANFGARGLRVGDIGALRAADLPGRADLAWASFPCQDLSLAGAGAGLDGARSGAFWRFAGLMRDLAAEGRAPPVIAVENVVGVLSSKGGADFRALIGAFADLGRDIGAAVIDASAFLPQSRQRLFLLGFDRSLPRPDPQPVAAAHPSLGRAIASLPADLQARVFLLDTPPPGRNADLASIIEEPPHGVCWNSEDKTARLLSLMDETNRRKVATAATSGGEQVGALYRRMRPDGAGGRRQRVEVRFDGLAGCLRTPAGGSSRQTLLFVDGERRRSRLLSPREAARLMGLPDDFVLPPRYSAAYHLLGDGVAPPVVRHLAATAIEPFLAGRRVRRAA